MSNGGFGQGPKKETLYSGPVPTPGQGTAYAGPAPSTGVGTVYNGPALGGTVYHGSTSGGAAYKGSPTGVLPSRPTAGPAAARSGAGAKGASIFFLIAAFTGINTVLIFAGVQFGIGLGATRTTNAALSSILVVNVVAIGIFVLLGIFARGGSKIAFLIGMLLYAGDLVLLIMNDPALHVISIVIHGLFLFYLFNAFRQLPD